MHARLRWSAVGAVLAVAIGMWGRPSAAQQVIVRQPEFRQFAVPTTVLVPDRGGVLLGGGRGGGQARDLRGPIPLGPSRTGGAGASSVSTRVSVHDFRAMDEAILRGADAGVVRPGLARPAPNRVIEPAAAAPREGWLRRKPPRR